MIWLVFGTIGILVGGVTLSLDYSDTDREVYEFEKRKALAQVVYWEFYNTVVIHWMKEDIKRQWELAAKIVEEDKLCK